MTVIQLFLPVSIHDIGYLQALRPEPVDDLADGNHAVLKLRNEPLACALCLVGINNRHKLQSLGQLVVGNAVVQPAIPAVHDIVDVSGC